jgi:hypothetical protein
MVIDDSAVRVRHTDIEERSRQMMMIRDIENALRTDGDRLYFIMSPQIVKEVRLRSPLKFAFELLCLDPNFCHSDRDLCGMKVGDLAYADISLF